MKAVIHHSFGEPAELLRVVDLATPEPGPGEVRVRIVLSAIHNHDLMIVRGLYGVRPDLPARAGSEAVGVIDAVGSGVTSLAENQRVTVSDDGLWAEYVVVPAREAVPVPDEIPDEVAALMSSMPFSAISLLDSLNLEPGEWIVQNAANGAVGRTLAKLAAARGVNVLGIVRRTQAVADLAEEGISHVVSTDDDDWRERAREMTGRAPLRAGIDSVGGDASGRLATLLAENGTLVIFGAMDALDVRIPIGPILFRNVKVEGFWANDLSGRFSRQRLRELSDELRQRIADGVVTLPTASIHPLEAISEAVSASLAPGRRGKVLVRP